MSWKRPLSLAILISGVSLIAACVSPVGVSRPTATAVAEPQGSGALAKTGDLVYLRNSQQDGAITVLDADTGSEVGRLPSGIATPDWTAIYGTQLSGANTLVRATDVVRNATVGERSIDSGGKGTYQLPAISFTGEPGGFSPNARWLALTTSAGLDYSNAGVPTKSAFVVLDSKLQQPSKFVELAGNYSFDAISDSGQYLYVEEHLGANGENGYRVRVYDVKAGLLLPGIVVDKSVGGDRMAGTRVGTLFSPDGSWQYTLYWRQGGNPFIHAIKLEEQWSLCLFLPVQTSGEQDFAWSFVASPDGRTAFAVNNLKGYVAEIALTSATVIKTATLDMQRAAAPGLIDSVARFFFPVAEAKSEMFSLSVVSPDGKTLFASGDYGRKLYAIDVDTLAVKARYAMDGAGAPLQITALGISGDGSRLYSFEADGNSLVRIDALTGKIVAQVKLAGHYGGRILRVVTR